MNYGFELFSWTVRGCPSIARWKNVRCSRVHFDFGTIETEILDNVQNYTMPPVLLRPWGPLCHMQVVKIIGIKGIRIQSDLKDRWAEFVFVRIPSPENEQIRWFGQFLSYMMVEHASYSAE